MLALFVGFDQLCDLRVRSHGLDQNDVTLVQKHSIRPVHVIPARHQHAAHCLRLLVDPALDVIHVRQLGKAGVGVRQLAVEKLIVVQRDRRVRRCDLRPFLPLAAVTRRQSCQSHHHCHQPHDLFQNAPLLDNCSFASTHPSARCGGASALESLPDRGACRPCPSSPPAAPARRFRGSRSAAGSTLPRCCCRLRSDSPDSATVHSASVHSASVLLPPAAPGSQQRSQPVASHADHSAPIPVPESHSSVPPLHVLPPSPPPESAWPRCSFHSCAGRSPSPDPDSLPPSPSPASRPCPPRSPPPLAPPRCSLPEPPLPFPPSAPLPSQCSSPGSGSSS